MARKQTVDERAERITAKAGSLMEAALGKASPIQGVYDPVDQLARKPAGVADRYAEHLRDLEANIFDEWEQGSGRTIRSDGTREKYNEKEGLTEAMHGRPPGGFGVTISYSGLARGGWKSVRSLVGSGDRTVTFEASMNEGGEDLPPAKLEVELPRWQEDDFDGKLAAYLHGIVMTAAREVSADMNDDPSVEQTRDFARFEGRLVGRVGKMVGSQTLGAKYMDLRVGSLAKTKIDRLIAQYEGAAAGERAKLDGRVTEVRKVADELSAALETRKVNADAEVATYRDGQIAAIDSARGEVLGRLKEFEERVRGETEQQAQTIRSRLENEIAGEARNEKRRLDRENSRTREELERFKTELAQRKGPVDEAKVYFTDQLRGLFGDYNVRGDDLDVNAAARGKYAKELARSMGDEKTKLGREEMVGLLTTLSRNVEMSGNRAFDATDVKELVGVTCRVAQMVGPDGLNTVLERMDTVGKRGRGRVPLVAMRAALNELLA
ncbi:MAG: hypothetical protein ABIH92_04055 [Nanoarchaeota archaeon]